MAAGSRHYLQRTVRLANRVWAPILRLWQMSVIDSNWLDIFSKALNDGGGNRTQSERNGPPVR